MAHDNVRRFFDRFGWERAVRDDPRFTGNTLGVLLALSTYSDKYGHLTVGIATLQNCGEWAEKTVRRALGAGIDADLLVRTRRGHHVPGGPPLASSYQLVNPPPPATLSGSGPEFGAADGTTGQPVTRDGKYAGRAHLRAVADTSAEPVTRAGESGGD